MQRALGRAQALLCLLLLLSSYATTHAGSHDAGRELEPGSRARLTRSGGEIVEGVVERSSAGEISLRCGNEPRPIPIPRWEIVHVEVWHPPPTRLEMYSGVGAVMGLGLALLMELPGATSDPCAGQDLRDCDPSSWSDHEPSMGRIIGLPLLGAGVGALVGLAVEGEGVWQPVGLRWSQAERGPQAYVALDF